MSSSSRHATWAACVHRVKVLLLPLANGFDTSCIDSALVLVGHLNTSIMNKKNVLEGGCLKICQHSEV
jgi:hypothetical protein